MFNLNASATKTLLCKFFCKEDKNDNLVYLFYGIFYDKKATELLKKKEKAQNEQKSFFSFFKNDSEEPIKNCYLILTEKKIKLYYEDLIDLHLDIPIVNVTEIIQDGINENLLKIQYLNDKIPEKLQIILENKIYFLEKFQEFYLYEKTSSENKLIFQFSPNPSETKSQKLELLNKDHPLNLVEKNKFENRIKVYENYIKSNNEKFEKINGFPEYNDENLKTNNIENEKQNIIINNNSYSNRKTNNNYLKTFFRYKKNLIVLPAHITKLCKDVLRIENPNNKRFPLKLILGSSKTLPVEILDYDTDVADIKEVAYETFLNSLKKIGGKFDFFITKCEKFNKNKEGDLVIQDYGKSEYYILEAKTKIKKNYFQNVIMLFNRKSFYPPFYDTFKDFYFIAIEKIELTNQHKNKNLKDRENSNILNKYSFKNSVLNESNKSNIFFNDVQGENIEENIFEQFDDARNVYDDLINNNCGDINEIENIEKISNNGNNNSNFNSKNMNSQICSVIRNSKITKDSKINNSNNFSHQEDQRNEISSKKEKSKILNESNISSFEIYEKDGKFYKKINSKINKDSKSSTINGEIYERDGKYYTKKKKIIIKEKSKINQNSNVNDSKCENYKNNLQNSNLNTENLKINSNMNKNDSPDKINNSVTTSRKTVKIKIKKEMRKSNEIINIDNIQKDQNSKENLENIKNKTQSIKPMNTTNNREIKNKTFENINNNSNSKNNHENSKPENSSTFAKDIIFEIGQSFNSMLTFNENFTNKLKNLSFIRLETFSCFETYYINMFHKISKDNNLTNLLNLKKIAIDILYKTLLILKECSIDQISSDLIKIEKKIKKIYKNQDENFVYIHRENIKKIDFLKILENNDDFLNSIFVGFYQKKDEDSKKSSKGIEKKTKFSNLEKNENFNVDDFTEYHQYNKSVLTSTKKFLIENRNDFLLFCLNGKIIKNLSIDLEKILRLSLKKEIIKSQIKNFIFPLLSLRSTLEYENKSDKDLINEICDSKDNSKIHISFNEHVMCAMIKSDFLRKGEIINKNSSYEKFLIYLIDYYGSNKVLEAIYYFFKEQKRNSLDYNLLVKKNFNKNIYIENHYKIASHQNKVIDDFITNDLEKSIISTDINIDINTPKPKNSLKDSFKSKIQESQITETKYSGAARVINLKNFINEVTHRFDLIIISRSNPNDELSKYKSEISNLFSKDSCYVLFKYYSSKDSNLKKIILSCKCLDLICKENSHNRKLLIEIGIFQAIFTHMVKFYEEKSLISTLKLLSSLLDHNDISVIKTLKANDKWDDYLENILYTLNHWKKQSIKCSTKLVSVLLDIYIKISNFSIVDISKLFTTGYENIENYNFYLEDLNQSDHEQDEKKTSKLLAFIHRLLHEDYVNKIFSDPENIFEVYEKTLIFLCKISDKIMNTNWITQLLDKIEDKFEEVLECFKNYYFKSNPVPFYDEEEDIENSEEGEKFFYFCKIYFINLNFFGFFYDYNNQQKFKARFNAENSPSGKILRFIKAVKDHKDFSYIFDQSIDYIQFLTNSIGFEEFTLDLKERINNQNKTAKQTGVHNIN